MARGVAGADNIPMRLFRKDIKALKRLIDSAEPAARDAMDEQVVLKLTRVMLADPIRKAAPVQKARGNRKLKHPPGRLRRSVVVNRSRRYQGIVYLRMGGKKAPHAPLLEFGFKPRGRGERIVRPFFFPTYNTHRDEYESRLAQLIGKRVGVVMKRKVDKRRMR